MRISNQKKCVVWSSTFSQVWVNFIGAKIICSTRSSWGNSPPVVHYLFCFYIFSLALSSSQIWIGSNLGANSNELKLFLASSFSEGTRKPEDGPHQRVVSTINANSFCYFVPDWDNMILLGSLSPHILSICFTLTQLIKAGCRCHSLWTR